MNKTGCCDGSKAVLFALLHAGQAVEERLERTLEPWGLSMAKMGALHHLATAGGPIPLGQLADRLSCVKSNVTQLVDRLEADGLARRVPDPNDRRSVLAVITDDGRARFDSAAAAQEQAEREILAGLGPEERATFDSLLNKVLAGTG
ncbi:MAG: yusO 1 [Gemmatimonadetes bacterium]|nr:yusO 1 [Gemmatimonadota bacterium]